MSSQQVMIEPDTKSGSFREHEIKIYGIGKCGSRLLLAIDESLVHREGVDAMACHQGYVNLQNKNGVSMVHWEDRFSFEDDHALSMKEKIEKANECGEILMDLATGSDIIILVGGIGGITGSNGISCIAEFFRHSRTKVIAFVVMPFQGEGDLRQENAETSLAKLKTACDVVVAFSNPRLLEVYPSDTLGASFHRIEKMFEQMVRRILDAKSPDNFDFLLEDPDALCISYSNENG
jgi:cell division GTPase FtsZ